MNMRHGLQLGLALVIALAGCGQAPEGKDTTTTSPAAPSEPTASPTIREIGEGSYFDPLQPGTYFIDPDGDPSTPLRVVYEIPVEGWSGWIGAVKFGDSGDLGVSIATVTNAVRHGCRDDRPLDPPVGSSADDFATAVADLAPFRVTSPPADVTIYGYSGKHLELTVPELPVEGKEDELTFTGCSEGDLNSWIGPLIPEGFSGYTHPGYREEFWVLDVDGTLLMVAAGRSPGAPPEDLAEQRAILESIRIEP